jgi:hypothetical protein
MKPCASRAKLRIGNCANDARRIERTFRFRNFREALAFVQRVGELAETEGHHPDISFGWASGSALAADRCSVSCSASHLAAASWRVWRRSALTVVIIR